VVACAIPGEFITGLEIFLRQFGDFWQTFKKKKKNLQTFSGVFEALLGDTKRRWRGPFLG